MRLQRKLTKRELKEIGEKYKDGGVHMYRGKRTLFYNGEKQLWDGGDWSGSPIFYDREERNTWDVIIILPGVEIIPMSTFKFCMNVKTVIMADTVREINYQAFSGCYSLEFVQLSKKLEFIGNKAFYFCRSLLSIFIPESCGKIGDEAFHRCVQLLILSVLQNTELGKDVIAGTQLMLNSTFGNTKGLYRDDGKVNKWIKSRHNNLPLHNLCCSEDPKFNQNTIIPTKQECLRQDDCGWTPLMYSLANHTAEYDFIEQMIKIGGKELLFHEDKKRMNSLHYAYDLAGDEAIIRLLVRIGGRELVDTLKSERIVKKSSRLRLVAHYDATKDMIKSALLLHDYIYAIENTNKNINLDRMIHTLLDTKPSFREITEIMGIQGIPYTYRQKFHEYKQSLLDQELKSLQDTQEKVPLMRSTITVVGRGQDGKTSTINSLKGLPFQPYCESTKGSQTSEVDVHEIGIDVSCVDATGVAFEAAERDAYSTKRAVAKHLINIYKDLEPLGEKDKVRMAANSSTPPTKKITESKIRPISSRFVNKLCRFICAKSKEKVKKKDEDMDEVRMAANGDTSPAKKITESKIRLTSSQLVDFDNAEKKAGIKLSNTETESIRLASKVSIEKEPRLEEDIATKVDDIDFPTGKDGKSIRFTIYDNGGQKVFRSIQHLFLSREGIFIVVFDMMKIFNKNAREDALEHLTYWLSSIKVDACETDNDANTDPSIKYPPVILVGTHYDEFLKLKKDPTERLQAVNKILVNNLPLSDLVPLGSQSNDFVPRDRQQLYNDSQDLCFWPVDNSNPNDANIQAIRKILLEVAINDPGFDIAQEVPISFLRAMDKLTVISEEIPILPIDSNDPQEYSIMKVMIECGVFEDGIDDEQKKLDICKAIVKQYQSIGHFIYFHQVGLEDYCILDPQWLIDMITYIVRDFKLHRFRRDFNAMGLNNGESWKSLLNKGILDGALLRKLWLDREHEAFLIKLMLELGIFGQLLCDVGEFVNAKFTVPIAMSISSNESREYSLPALREYLGVKSLNDAMKEVIDMSSCPFNLVPFYSRLVNRLISEWYRGCSIETNPPELLPCAANLSLGEDHKFSILINEEDSTLDILVSDQKKMNMILKYILEACSFVNAHVYQSRLDLGIPAVNIGNEVIVRDTINATATLTVSGIHQETKECHPNLQALLDVFENEKFARKIHEKDEDVTPEELIQMYYSDSDSFVHDILPELGIMQKLEQFRFVAILKSKPKPLEDELYAIFNFLDGNYLAGVKGEEEVIRKNMRMSSYFSFAYKVLRDDEIYERLHSELVAHKECKVVHFGMHRSSIDTFFTTTLASRLQESSVKCIILNMCESKHIAEDLRDTARIEKVVYWISAVEDNAARAFSEAFYYYLCVNKKENYLEFRKAFKFAQERLQLRGYLLIDPANTEELEQNKRAQRNPTLKAAGIPVFYDRSKQQSNSHNYDIVNPNECEVMISFNDASAGKDAVSLCQYLNSKGKKVFCTGVFCPKNRGDWRIYTSIGANKCKIFIALMTNGWQKSGECQDETKIIKNRLARHEVDVIPVYYRCFDNNYDKDTNHFYRTNWASYQGIQCKEDDGNWMETILEYLDD